MILPHAAAPIARNPPNMTILRDASNFGWGAQFGEIRVQGKFNVEQRKLHINTKEVIATYYAVKSFRPYFTSNHLMLRCDNTTAITNIWDMVHYSLQSEMTTAECSGSKCMKRAAGCQ